MPDSSSGVPTKAFTHASGRPRIATGRLAPPPPARSAGSAPLDEDARAPQRVRERGVGPEAGRFRRAAEHDRFSGDRMTD